MSQSILIVAGEASGDNVGGLLAAELKLSRPELELFGLGGDRMDISGVDLRYHVNQLSFLGFWEIIKHIPFMKNVERDLLEQVEHRKPSLAILIDYPGFNLRLAKKLKARNVPVIYYVSPQVWAWGKGRVKKIKDLVNLMIVIFKFEKEIYENADVPVVWNGHPLLEIVKSNLDKNELLTKIGLSESGCYIGLFPGSRIQEIAKILPVMKEAFEWFKRIKPHFKAVVGCAPGIDQSFYQNIGGRDLIYSSGLTYDLMNHAELNLVASGTATLECAILGSPLFVLYKTSPITYHLAKTLIKIPNIGLVNVVAGKRIVPEFVQDHCNPAIIAQEIEKFFESPQLIEDMKEKLAEIRHKLGEPGASMKTAGTILSILDNQARLTSSSI